MRVGTRRRIKLSKEKLENGPEPSISPLFRSIAEVLGEGMVGILLADMGKDGVEELRLMRKKGATTIVHDKESSIVFGMLGEAIRIGAVT